MGDGCTRAMCEVCMKVEEDSIDWSICLELMSFSRRFSRLP